jgi:hypothetical protein
MKKVIVAIMLVGLSVSAYSAVRCAPSTMGQGTCCWDTVRDGIFQPIGC